MTSVSESVETPAKLGYSDSVAYHVCPQVEFYQALVYKRIYKVPSLGQLLNSAATELREDSGLVLAINDLIRRASKSLHDKCILKGEHRVWVRK